MKIAVRAGHNVYNAGKFDPGAVGNGKREADITKETVRILIPLLRSMGHQVLDVTPYNKKFSHARNHHIEMGKAADNWGADILVDVHINSGGGTGVECWTYSPNSKATPYADKICKNLSQSLKFRNRGVKHNKGYWTLALCRTPGIIVEGAFIDNANDMKKLTPQKYAENIAKAFGTISKPKPKEHWAEKHYQSLQKKGITIHDKRFDDPITRGEVFALLDRLK